MDIKYQLRKTFIIVDTINESSNRSLKNNSIDNLIK